jgi:hypothetical protein
MPFGHSEVDSSQNNFFSGVIDVNWCKLRNELQVQRWQRFGLMDCLWVYGKMHY